MEKSSIFAVELIIIKQYGTKINVGIAEMERQARQKSALARRGAAGW
jgi:hypothetical protein